MRSAMASAQSGSDSEADVGLLEGRRSLFDNTIRIQPSYSTDEYDEEESPNVLRYIYRQKGLFKKWFYVPREFFYVFVLSSLLYGLISFLVLRQAWHLPAPVPANTTADQFSALRAMDVLYNLSVAIGSRPVASSGWVAANESLCNHFIALNQTIPPQTNITVDNPGRKPTFDDLLSPVIELWVQTASGAYRFGEVDGYEANLINLANQNGSIAINPQQGWGGEETTYQYTDITNVVVRVSSVAPELRETQDVIVVSAHFDTVFTGPGASDDGLSISVMVEMIQNLANSNPALNAVVFNLNGAEETGLQGSHAFITQHPWAKNARAFINLDNIGNKGKELVFNSCYGALVLAAYASFAPYPFANVVGEDVFNTGLIPSDTDFHIYEEYGQIPGIDVAFAMHSYYYHTENDVYSNISAGSVQRVGENIFATVRALANTTISLNATNANATNTKYVYYDIFGWQMVIISYSNQAGMTIGILVIIFITLSLVFLWKFRHCRRRGQSVFMLFVLPIGLDFFSLLISLLFALTIPITVAAFLANLLERPMSWFCAPLLAFFLFASPAFVAILAVRWLVDWLHETKLPKPYVGEFEIVDERQIPASLVMLPDESFSCALILFWSIFCIVPLALQLGVVYIPTLFVTFIASGLLLSSIVRLMKEKFSDIEEENIKHYNPYWFINFAISFVVPVAFLMYIVYIFISVEIPTTGRSGFSFPADIIIAGLVGFGAFLSLTPVLPFTSLGKNYGKVILVFSICAIVAIIVASQTNPYNGTCPKKLHLFHRYNINTQKAAAGFSSLDPRSIEHMGPIVNQIDPSLQLYFNCSRTSCIAVSNTTDNPAFNLTGIATPEASIKECIYQSGLTNVTVMINHPDTVFSIINITTPTAIQEWSLTATPPLPLPARNPPEGGGNSTTNSTLYGDDEYESSQYPLPSRYFVTHIAGMEGNWSFWMTFAAKLSTASPVRINIQTTYINNEVSPIVSAVEPLLPEWTERDSYNYFTYINLGVSYSLPVEENFLCPSI